MIANALLPPVSVMDEWLPLRVCWRYFGPVLDSDKCGDVLADAESTTLCALLLALPLG